MGGVVGVSEQKAHTAAPTAVRQGGGLFMFPIREMENKIVLFSFCFRSRTRI